MIAVGKRRVKKHEVHAIFSSRTSLRPVTGDFYFSDRRMRLPFAQRKAVATVRDPTGSC